MAYKISVVGPELVPDVWPKVEHYLQSVIDITDGRTTLVDTLNRVLKDEATLWIIYDEESLTIVGASITRINCYTAAKFLVVEMLAGDYFDDWMDQMNSSFILFAKHFECIGLELIGRRGWVKKLSRLQWKERFTTMQLLFEDVDGQKLGVINPHDTECSK